MEILYALELLSHLFPIMNEKSDVQWKNYTDKNHNAGLAFRGGFINKNTKEFYCLSW